MDTSETKEKIIANCCKCGCEMTEQEVWVPDNMKDNRLYCFSCAPDDALRQIDCIIKEVR